MSEFERGFTLTNVYDRLKELGITLPAAPEPAGLYIPCQTTGNLIYTSGHDCKTDGVFPYEGKVGQTVSIEEGYEAARLTMINLLATLENELGDLNRITKFVKLLCFVQSGDDFTQQPAVMNGASQLLLDVFGEKGQHARTALSAPALPFNIPLEIELIAEFD